jgi:hypothetical protein
MRFSAIDRTYANAALATGRSEQDLRAMGELVFASMLYHALRARGNFTWSVVQIDHVDGRLEVEVNVPRGRLRAAPLIPPDRDRDAMLERHGLLLVASKTNWSQL